MNFALWCLTDRARVASLSGSKGADGGSGGCGGLHTNTHDVGSRASIMRFMVGALAELLCADDDAEVTSVLRSL